MFSTIVPTIDTTTISPTGTKTVTLFDRQASVAGSRSTPSFESARALTPRMAKISAAPSRALPADSMLSRLPSLGIAQSRSEAQGAAIPIGNAVTDSPTVAWASVRERRRTGDTLCMPSGRDLRRCGGSGDSGGEVEIIDAADLE